MQLYGLIGYPLGHSFSKKYFSEKFAREGIDDAQFELFPLPDIAGLPGLLSAHPSLRGLSVTIPHKQTVIPHLDVLDETAQAVGAVNCIKIEQGQLSGYNTDVIGFEQSLETIAPEQWTADGGAAIVLGTGGASRAVAYVLKKRGIPFRFVSRNPAGDNSMSYDDFHHLSTRQYSLIVNTTPVGTFPDADNCPEVPFERLTPKHLVYDLIYNPSETLLLQRARAKGCFVKNGLEMLHLQAEANWRIWQ